MSALSRRADALGQSLRRLAGQPVTTGLALALATLALLIPALIATLAWPVIAAWRAADAPAQALVFVDSGASADQIEALRARVAAQAGVAGATYVSRDAVRDSLQRRGAGSLPELNSGLLPESIAVRFARGLPPEDAETTVAAVRKLARVDAVHFDAGLYRRWSTTVRLATVAAAVAAALLAALSALALAGAARLPSMTPADELRLLALVGSAPRDRRRPYAYAGAIIGLIAGLLACSATAAIMAVAQPLLLEIDALIGSTLDWTLLPWLAQASLVGAGALSGALAGALAGRHADRRAAP